MILFANPAIARVGNFFRPCVAFPFRFERPAGMDHANPRLDRQAACCESSAQRIFYISQMTQHADFETILAGLLAPEGRRCRLGNDPRLRTHLGWHVLEPSLLLN